MVFSSFFITDSGVLDKFDWKMLRGGRKTTLESHPQCFLFARKTKRSISKEKKLD